MKKNKSALIPKVVALRKSGMSLSNACKKVGLTAQTFYNHTKGRKSVKANTVTSPAMPKFDKNSIVMLIVPPAKAKAMLASLTR